MNKLQKEEVKRLAKTISDHLEKAWNDFKFKPVSRDAIAEYTRSGIMFLLDRQNAMEYKKHISLKVDQINDEILVSPLNFFTALALKGILFFPAAHGVTEYRHSTCTYIWKNDQLFVKAKKPIEFIEIKLSFNTK